MLKILDELDNVRGLCRGTSYWDCRGLAGKAQVDPLHFFLRFFIVFEKNKLSGNFIKCIWHDVLLPLNSMKRMAHLLTRWAVGDTCLERQVVVLPFPLDRYCLSGNKLAWWFWFLNFLHLSRLLAVAVWKNLLGGKLTRCGKGTRRHRFFQCSVFLQSTPPIAFVMSTASRMDWCMTCLSPVKWIPCGFAGAGWLAGVGFALGLGTGSGFFPSTMRRVYMARL